MADINHVILVGRLTRDAELKYTNNGYAYTNFSLAVNKRKKQGDEWTEEGHFFDVVLWGKIAEALCQYMTKGKQIGVQGELSQDRWEQDGQNRSKVKIIANNIQLLGGKSNNSGSQNQSQIKQSNPAPASLASNDFEDDIPFI